MRPTLPVEPPRADLVKREFDVLINQKGQDVILETALECPCKSESTNQQSNCKNCGGSGWLFINARKTRMVLTAINAVTEFRPWSEELRGTVNITSFVEDNLSIMDRITLIEGESIHNEVLFLKKKEDVVFARTTYNVKNIDFIALFKSSNDKLQHLVGGVDFIVRQDFIIFSSDFVSKNNITDLKSSSITVRYKYAPQFHVIEMKRDTMQSFQWIQTEVNQSMPVSAIGRRAHYQLSANNLNGDRLLDNSLVKPDCAVSPNYIYIENSDFAKDYSKWLELMSSVFK